MLSYHVHGAGPVCVAHSGGPGMICGMRWGQELHELIPGSQLLILENSGHFGHLEEPERFAETVAAFFAG